jgi:hypothetical protein
MLKVGKVRVHKVAQASQELCWTKDFPHFVNSFESEQNLKNTIIKSVIYLAYLREMTKKSTTFNFCLLTY